MLRDADRRCDGVSRRDALRVGALTALGLTLSDWYRLRATVPLPEAALPEAALPGERAPRTRARSCILLWLDGGPSHLDTFDLKPEAPAEVRGPFRPISTKVPGLQICEHLERTARVAHKLSIIRSMTSPLGEHNFGSHYLLTGYKPTPALVYPSLGSVVAAVQQKPSVLPPHVAVGSRPNGMNGPGYLPPRFGPFVLGGDPSKKDFKVRDLDLYPEVTVDRLQRRREYLEALDDFSRLVEEKAEKPSDPAFQQAYRLVTSPGAKKAFDLSEEKRDVRQRYGFKTLGQSCLIARRLVERGVPFVTVTDRGWDTHVGLFTRLKEGFTGGSVGKIPTLDVALSALVEDLDERGLLGETLIVVMGEFGRTPKVNTAGGRDHWPRVFSVVLAGAGVPGGQVIGESDPVGESPAERPVTPADLAYTIYSILGIRPQHEFVTGDGRPVTVNRDGQPIRELLG
ncbi:MAG: DUF1501 domain-containing protein [Planctomycetota bacterium]|nr:DUF1501 domain-containing protein [Planctomycetota bacterium]